MKRMAVVQAVLVAIVLVVCVAMPRPGSAVLLIPVGWSAPANWPGLQQASPDVLRAGALRGSVLVRADGEVPVLALLRAGWLPVAAPRWLCEAPV